MQTASEPPKTYSVSYLPLRTIVLYVVAAILVTLGIVGFALSLYHELNMKPYYKELTTTKLSADAISAWFDQNQ